ncbi:MAG: helix-turn-helix domain-containing protein [Treponema sp.]|nr:helix-turn-helix domain-containing protein [Treponema sp.]
MESLGNKLKEAREAKGYTFDYVGRETNIAARYLEALEQEDFSKFPGEPYALGFLRNYGEYLGLDVEELLSLYRSLKIQEQPVPVEALLKSPSFLPRILLGALIVLLVLGALGGGAFFVVKILPGKAPEAAAARTPGVYTMNIDSMERRFYQGDTILIPLENDQYKLEFLSHGEALTLNSPRGPVTLDLGQEVTADLNNDGFAELRITALEFSKNDPASGALLRFDREMFLPERTAGEDGTGPGLSEETVNIPASASSGTVVIFSSPSAYPFTLQAVFQGYCLFRWEIDRRDRNEQYRQRSDELHIQARDGIRIWVSNAQAVKLQVIGGGRTVPLELGGAGEVVVADLRWVRDEDNRRLVFSRLD